ncbi:amidohydrolase [Kitasatospora sp. MAP5-34]|uniref:amidohydrolase n=1 Tax=Kitasatospora sp. MAP5-34 TaxID=3035102 RepID=UPI002474CEC6|nr:amidohydrolase [Kitasatospora sp. MAP5-34]MDH6577930.1 putative amidohydrolase YtcJ [Kitasatospora sp. MAP5-34]
MAIDPPGGAASGDADVIFFGGEIVTVAAEETELAPEAVAVRDGRIVFVGDRSRAFEDWQGDGTALRDLRGRTLLPGFIDAHGHLTGTGLQATIANLLAEPDGDVTDLDSLRQKLREFADSPVGRRSEWIIGFGYDDSMLDGRQHPTRADLDEVSTERPVLAIHQSFHLGAVNSKGLEVLGYGKGTPDPPGGVIRRESDLVRPYGVPNGVLEESAFLPASGLAIDGMDPADVGQFLFKGLRAAASFGFTTVQEGAASLDVLDAMREAADEYPGGFPADVVVYVKAGEAVAEPGRVRAGREYVGGLRAGGIKMVLDGSPQGRTAWLTEPYTTRPDGTEEGYCGYRAIEDDVALTQLRAGFENGWQVIAHVNGDAAIDQFVRTARTVTAEAGPADRRPVAIHAQTARADQLDAFAELGVIPSFFSMHTYYWGDWYRETVFGKTRAAEISPARWALDRGLSYTSHHDAPVALPNSIAILSSQVTRVTRSGHVLGRHQRVSALDALKSVTINAARQYFEQDSKGSIEVGKLADLVILSDNPLQIPAKAIKDLTVEETIKAGVTVYNAADSEEPEPVSVSARVTPAPHC